MKNRLTTWGLALVAGLVAFGVFYLCGDDAALRRAAREGDALAWLRIEFKLSDAQFAAIKQLHTDYTVECSGHCAAIMAARDRGAPAPEISKLEEVCVASILVHFQRVAALMPAGEGDRYLAQVLPRLSGYEHTGAPTVRGTP
jgi:hypothetical protein